MKEPATSRTRTSKPKGRKAAARHTRVIAVANQKGGVGKSTTAVSLGAALAELGYRVLVVDLDPQGNASTGLGIRHERREVTVYDVLAAEAPVEGAVVATPIEGLDAIPSTIDLAGAEIELVSQFSRELRLRRALEPLKDGVYDFVLLDCPPSLGLLTVNALAAADELIVPIQCEYYALEGLGQLLRNVRLVQQNVNPGLRLTGIVLTMYDPRTKLSEQVVEEVRRFFGDRVYETVIPRTVRLSEAPGFGQPITVYDPRSRGAESYRALAREVAARAPTDEPIPSFESVPKVVVPPPEPQPMQAPRPLRPEEPERVEAEAAEELAERPGPQVAVETEATGQGRSGEEPRPAAREVEGESHPEAEVGASPEVGSGTEPAPAGGTDVVTGGPQGEEEAGLDRTPTVPEARAEPEGIGGAGAEGEVQVSQRVGAVEEAARARAEPEPVLEGADLRPDAPPDADGTERLIAVLEAEATVEPPPAPPAPPSPRVVEIELEEELGSEPQPEAVVRITDRDAAGEHGEGAAGGERRTKRRWSLFRRGGER